MCCYASSLAGAEKAAGEDKAVAAVTRGDSDKPKQVPPTQEGKEEAPEAAAAQPKEQAEQLDVKEVPAEGQQPGGDVKNPLGHPVLLPGSAAWSRASVFSPRHSALPRCRRCHPGGPCRRLPQPHAARGGLDGRQQPHGQGQRPPARRHGRCVCGDSSAGDFAVFPFPSWEEDGAEGKARLKPCWFCWCGLHRENTAPSHRAREQSWGGVGNAALFAQEL